MIVDCFLKIVSLFRIYFACDISYDEYIQLSKNNGQMVGLFLRMMA